MEFIQYPYLPGETIAAIATPLGEGGISIIRISGSQAIQVAEKIFSKAVSTYQSHSAHLGYVHDSEGNLIDQALLLLMLGPRSFTGEDTVELQCHGGMIASRKVLEVCLAAGARAALPGEFTFKAYMNGKLDLTQAEAIQKLISAKNEQAFTAAHKHLEGALSSKIKSFQHDLVQIGAILEAWVDFPEEGLEFASKEEILERLNQLQQKMKKLLNTFEEGKKIDQGISLCIVGAPNVGKSSLMNALLDEERAIVTPIEGTTRDLLHEELRLGGLHFKLTDTAGIRQTEEIVEQEGIRRSKAALLAADIVLLVLDATRPLSTEEQELASSLPKEKTVALWNKIDLAPLSICSASFTHELHISAKEGTGLEQLKQALHQLVWEHGAPEKDEVLITNVRHKEALAHAVDHVELIISGLKQALSPEFLTADLRATLEALGRMIGLNITEEILSSIFSQFCVGK